MTHLYSFTGLHIIQNNPQTEQNQNNNTNKNQKTIQQQNANPQTHQNQKYLKKKEKIKKMTEKILPQDQKQKSEPRESSRLRSQPRKHYKTFIPQSKILMKVEFQKQL